MAICACFVLAGLALSRPRFPFDGGSFRSGTSIYPWWSWGLVAAGLVAGAGVLTVPRRARSARVAACAVVVVVGTQLTGLAVVAAKHWKPASGMGGYYGDPDRLRRLAITIAVLAVAGVALALWQLVADGAFRRAGRGRWRSVSTACGVGMLVLLPLAVGLGDQEARDLTTRGAIELIYAGPWALGLLLAGRLVRPASVTMLATVAASAATATVGPQMIDLLFGSTTAQFAVAMLVVLVLLVAALRESDQPARTGPRHVARLDA